MGHQSLPLPLTSKERKANSHHSGVIWISGRGVTLHFNLAWGRNLLFCQMRTWHRMFWVEVPEQMWVNYTDYIYIWPQVISKWGWTFAGAYEFISRHGLEWTLLRFLIHSAKYFYQMLWYSLMKNLESNVWSWTRLWRHRLKFWVEEEEDKLCLKHQWLLGYPTPQYKRRRCVWEKTRANGTHVWLVCTEQITKGKGVKEMAEDYLNKEDGGQNLGDSLCSLTRERLRLGEGGWGDTRLIQQARGESAVPDASTRRWAALRETD